MIEDFENKDYNCLLITIQGLLGMQHLASFVHSFFTTCEKSCGVKIENEVNVT